MNKIQITVTVEIDRALLEDDAYQVIRVSEGAVFDFLDKNDYEIFAINANGEKLNA